MKPFQFGHPDKPLYGVYQPPFSDSTQNRCVLLCLPIALEQQQSQWALKQLTIRLSRLGYHSLRFDYFATGNSSGATDESNTQQWLEDINLAAQELLNKSGENAKLTIIGLRFGATLAALAAEKLQVENLILWDPIVNGTQYLNDLNLVHKAKLKSLGRLNEFDDNRQPYDLMGFVFPKQLLTDIQKIDLIKHKLDHGKKLIIFVDKSKPIQQKLLETLDEKQINYNKQVLEDIYNWQDIETIESSLLPNMTIKTICALLREAKS